VIRPQLDDNAPRLGYEQAWNQWDHPPSFRTTRLEAVKVGLGAVAVCIVLDAKRGDFTVYRVGDLALGLLELGPLLGRCPDDIQGSPGQHAGDGVQVRRVDVTAQPRCLEGDGAAAAEGVANAGPLSIAQHAELCRDPRALHRSGMSPAHVPADPV